MARKDLNSYFSHDSNARNDEKILRLRMKHGAAGYGVYFMILERLREEADYVSAKDYNMIAFDFRVDSAIVKSVVEDFRLFAFTDDGKGFYSESFLQRMNIKDSVRNKCKDAAVARWGKKSGTPISEIPTTETSARSSENEVVSPTKKSAPHPQQSPAPVPDHPADSPASPAPVTPVPSAPYTSTVDREVAEMKCDLSWKENVAIRYQLTAPQLDSYLADFALKCDKSHTSLQDARSHFCYWLQKQLDTRPKTATKPSPSKPTRQKSRPAPPPVDSAAELRDYLASRGLDPSATDLAKVAAADSAADFAKVPQ